MWRKGSHYSLKNSILIQKTNSENERIFSYPRHKAPGKGATKTEQGRPKGREERGKAWKTFFVK